MPAADQAVAAHLDGIRRGEGNSDGVSMHVQTDVEGRAARDAAAALDDLFGLGIGHFDELRFLRLDRIEGTEYVGLHGVCFLCYEWCELRFTTLGLGPPALAVAQSPFPESRHLFGFHQKPYCLVLPIHAP